jgi:hypothetical protein
MAKPIRSTPTLKGADAVNFVKALLKEEKNPSLARVRTINEAMDKSEYFEQFIVHHS